MRRSPPPSLPGFDLEPAAPKLGEADRASLRDRHGEPGQTAAKPPVPRTRPAAPESAAPGQRFEACAEIAVAAQVDALTYGVPDSLRAVVVPGQCVTVPLRGRAVTGVVLAVRAIGEAGGWLDKLRPILAVPDDSIRLPADVMATLQFAAYYYHAPIGQCARLALPAALRRTGIGDDQRAERQQQWVAATYLRPWPLDLAKSQIRLLHRIEAESALPVAELRKKAPVDAPEGASKLAAATAVLQALAAKGLVRLWQQRVLRDPLGLREPPVPDVAPALTADQAIVVADLTAAVQARAYSGHLLFGVTGSGKTEVYLRLIGDALAQGRGAIVLVPEIALTPQLVQRFRSRFGDQVAALHSAMSEGERLDQLDRVQRGERRIVVGPRSALFAPMADVGAVVVDECHDSSYKQAHGVRYQARDLALVRARAAGAVCVLGSATPACEDWQLQQTGKLTLHELPRRAVAAQMPAIALVDLRTAPRLRDIEGAAGLSLLSEALVQAIGDTVARGEQAMVLHNRRGFATAMLCRACGATVECAECAVALTWHKKQGRLRCHWCDLSLPDEASCPTCKAPNLIGVGAGSERIEMTLAEALRTRLPQVSIARFDRDSVSGQRLMETLAAFRTGQIDVLVGTQLLANGHDFPKVTLVGVVLAEEGLRVPDFRATERTFQLLTQVAGRAGRGDRPGTVLIQTYKPDHFAIAAALGHDARGFAAAESAARQRCAMPPFAYLALFETSHADPNHARGALRVVVDALRGWGGDVRGPVAASVSRVRDVWRFHALVKAQDRRALHTLVGRLLREVAPGLPSNVGLAVDVDPGAFA